MRKLVLGILAHVDAGKTTLSESILYKSGTIRKLGRVDNKDAFLDTNRLERERGITIFSKQAVFLLGNTKVTLLDTPGHVDFAAEMERTLSVLDYAVLVVSGADGVQGHTMTLWRLLKRYRVPVFLFVNKMDQDGTDKTALMQEIKEKLSGNCVDFTQEMSDAFFDEIAMCDEEAMEQYLETESVEEDLIRKLIQKRMLFPCYFGSALKVEGVEELLEGIECYADTADDLCEPDNAKTTGVKSSAMQELGSAKDSGSQDFGAKVFKIARDEQGNRLTFLKITGGTLSVKTSLEGGIGENAWEEKVNQIRIYSGEKYEAVSEVTAGDVCAVTGLTMTRPGEGLGYESASDMPILEPVLTYRLLLPAECSAAVMMPKLRQLEEEEPELHIVWKEETQEILVQLMGEVQIEILQGLIKERFGVVVEFGTGKIVYKETIADTVEGVGHFEPLRHYAEVHLLMEAGEPGSGLTIASDCSEDVLNRNWQRLILTHLNEREHRGVLTGSVITDMKITVVGGQAHQKHTEGGDFRQAAYRAVRQGLMQAESVLLEPVYDFRMEVPEENLGRAMTDVERMSGRCDAPVTENHTAILTGSAPVSTMQDYQKELTAYTKGHGKMSVAFRGYEPCHNRDEVVEAIGYDAMADTLHPSDSVFCAHGAGFLVPWYEVADYMHVPAYLTDEADGAYGDGTKEDGRYMAGGASGAQNGRKAGYREPKVDAWIDTEEIDAILERTFDANKRNKSVPRKGVVRRYTKAVSDAPVTRNCRKQEILEKYLLVDGYNVIFAWQELKELAEVSIDGARGKLMDILCNYQGIRGGELIVVFDAYRIRGHQTEYFDYHNIHVVYTKEAETADQYIEKTVHEIGRKHKVTVATSDRLEQIIILGQGGNRIAAREFKEEIERTNGEIRTEFLEKMPKGRNYLFDNLDDELAAYMEDIRLGRKKTQDNTEK